MHGKVDTTISCIYVCLYALLALPSVLGVWSIAVVLCLPFECYYY